MSASHLIPGAKRWKTMIDYSAGEALPNDDELTTISDLAAKLVWSQDQVKFAKAALDKAKAVEIALRTEALPEAMKQIGLTDIKLSNGAEVMIKDGVSCSITETNKSNAFAWLRGHGHGDIIKNEVKVAFGMGEDSEKDNLLEFIDQHGWRCTPDEKVLTQTLNAWAKRQLEGDSEDIPEDLITVFRYSEAKVKLPK